MSALLFGGEQEAWADVSPCGRYRYRLGRRWDGGKTMLFVMLNPSTADAHQDDPTIRRCIWFAKRDGCGALEVVNLFALRATDPAELLGAHEPIGGAKNYQAIVAAAGCASVVVAAWGSSVPRAHAAQPGRVFALLRAHGPGPVFALKVTAAGAPGHPLYLPASSPLVPFGGAS